jgi:hypothetical protein
MVINMKQWLLKESIFALTTVLLLILALRTVLMQITHVLPVDRHIVGAQELVGFTRVQ